MTLTDNEKRVMGALGHASEDFGCYGFDTLAQSLGMDKGTVRDCCRSLRDKRLVEYHQNVWSEDGEMCGAAYGATAAGRAFVAKDNSIPYIEV